MDELLELLTLAQTGKLARKIPILLYGPEFWNEVINFDALVRHGMIDGDDLGLFQFADDPATALRILQAELASTSGEAVPAFARSRTNPIPED
jgi:predicted Rossmann-fold nucleotide-binding protein